MKQKIKGKVLLKPKDFEPSFKSLEIQGVLNPGGIRLPNKDIVLFVRVAESSKQSYEKSTICPVMASEKQYKVKYEKIHKTDIIRVGRWKEMYLKDGTCRLPNISHFRKVILDKDGFRIKKIEQRPAFTGIPVESDYGVEDPRITKIGNKYYMTYVGISANEGVSTYLAVSNDLNKWKRLGLIFREQNKDVVLFPEKIRGEYIALNRPESNFNFAKPGIWISYSKDLIYWGKDSNLIRPRKDSWENERVGGGCPPIKTKKGWLEIYHGMKDLGEGKRIYSGGALLLDLKNPDKILARSPIKNPLIIPNLDEEKKGFINNVVFPTAAIPTLDGKGLLIYSGGADSIITVREISFEDIFKNIKVKI